MREDRRSSGDSAELKEEKEEKEEEKKGAAEPAGRVRNISHPQDSQTEECSGKPQGQAAEESDVEKLMVQSVQNDGANSKEKKRSGRLPTFFAGAAAGVLAAGAAALLFAGYVTVPLPGGQTLTVLLPTYRRDAASDESRTQLNYRAISRKMHEIDGKLNESYYYDRHAQEIEDGIFRGMLYGLTEEDRYAEYYSKEEAEELEESISGNYQGIGAVVSQDPDTLAITIRQVLKDSPAEEAGLLAGDILKQVDGTDVSGMQLDQVVSDYVKGPDGTKVTLTVERNGEEQSFTCTRRKMDHISVSSSMLLEKPYGYINVSSFEQNTVGQFKKAVDELTDQGAQALIIDLRDNGGGDMNAALKMLDYLVSDKENPTSPDSAGDEAGKGAAGEGAAGEAKAQTALTAADSTGSEGSKPAQDDSGVPEKTEGLLLYIKNRSGAEQTFYASDGHAVSIPVVFLTNANTASASEIFSGAMRCYGAHTVGTKTYGKGIVQDIVTLADGSIIKYTSAEYFLPDGTALHEKGIAPDVPVDETEAMLAGGLSPDAPDPVKDAQLAAAVQYLEQGSR